MNPFITTKPKQQNKNNSNHYIRWAMVTIILLLIIFFSTGCSKSDNSELDPTYNMSNFKVDNQTIMEVEYKYNVQMPHIDVIPEEGELIESDTEKIYNLTLPLSDLGLSSTKTITLTTTLEKE